MMVRLRPKRDEWVHPRYVDISCASSIEGHVHDAGYSFLNISRFQGVVIAEA